MTAYLVPASIEEAARILGDYRGEARLVAGGTDVMPDLRKGKIRPRALVDITRIPELGQIQITEDFVQLGAAVTFAAIKDSPFVNAHVHALADAARSVGAIGIQNAATWVGNLVQAMPAADGAIIAIALEAEARVVTAQGSTGSGLSTNWQPVETLFQGPGVSAIDPSRQFVTHVRFPRPSARCGTAWQRLGRRPSLVLPILNCGVKLALNLDGTRIEHVTITLGPVAPCPFRARRAEAFLERGGAPPAVEAFTEAGHIAQSESHPRSSVMRASREYRLAVIPSLVCDALCLAAKRARRAI